MKRESGKLTFGPVLAIVLGMFIVILDSTIMNVALPNLIETFHSDISAMQWTITAYTLSLAAVIPLAGWFMDRYGAKRVFLTTIVLFMLGSLLCSIAKTPGQLVLFRIIQGLGGGMVSPIGLAIVFKHAPTRKQGSVMGKLGIPMMLAPAIGPTLSGFLIEYVSWHWIFLINVPFGILALFLGSRYLPSMEEKADHDLDGRGMILAPLTFALLVYSVSEGSDGESLQTLVCLIGGLAGLILLIVTELRHQHPLLELRVFGSPGFKRGVLVQWILQSSLFCNFVLVPMYVQTIKELSPMQAGMLTIPQVVISGLLMPYGGKWFDRIGARWLCTVGLILIGGGLLILSRLSSEHALGYVILAVMLTGAGMGVSMMPISTHILKSAPPQWINRVTPLTAAAVQVVVSFAIVGITGFYSYRHAHYFVDSIDIARPMALAFKDTFLVSAILAFTGAMLALILLRPIETTPREVQRLATDQNH